MPGNANSSERSDERSMDDPTSRFLGAVIARTLAIVGTVMVLLSLLSYSPDDTHILAGGLRAYATVRNWIGLFGAHLAAQLLAWIGLAAYAGIFLLVVCVINRTVSKSLPPVGRIYFAGILILILGMAMLLGAFPRSFASICANLNISRTPGGVIGQRFCAPWSVGQPGGWLVYVVNSTGSILIALAMVTIGLVALWHFDWRGRPTLLLQFLRTRWQKRRSAPAVSADGSVSEEKIAETEPEAPTESVVQPEEIQRASVLPVDTQESPRAVQEKTPDSAVPIAVPKKAGKPARSGRKYILPSFDLLHKATGTGEVYNPAEIESKKEILQETLDSFSIDAVVGDTTSGPRVTLFEIKPAPGVKVEKISSLANNIAMNLKAESLRILTPVPGKDTVGIEVPNRTSSNVLVRSLLETREWSKAKADIPLVVGKDISGKPVILDLAKAPHLLIAGATGSGKSVCMNTIILSLLYRFSPDELKLIMVDPKVVEFSGYNSLPHLLTPVVTQVKKVPVVLRWILGQMEWRYAILSKVGVRNIAAFNSRPAAAEPVLDDSGVPIPERLPYLIVIIDELADIMMTAKADVETALARIAQLARAVGIHAIVATQRPSVNVITGIIKANFPTRIAFQVTSIVDSRTILDGKGAESLLGRGDMLFKGPSGGRIERTQGAMVEDVEIQQVVEFVSKQAEPEYIEDILSYGTAKNEPQATPSMPTTASAGAPMETPGPIGDDSSMDDETLAQRATEIILRDRRATVSHIQRRLRIGYNRAALVMEQLERRGVIGPQIGTAPRQILIEGEPETKGDGDTVE